MKHLLSLESLSREAMETILQSSIAVKKYRGAESLRPLDRQTWALIFAKSSTRTRVSFEVGIRELGGSAMFLSGADLQLGRGEPIRDTARVLGRMVHGAVIRTFAQQDVEDFAQYAQIPTINALTDEEHPCQILADLFTIQEKLGSYRSKVVTFIGDGACNVARSWIFAAVKLGFELRIAAPKAFYPSAEIMERVSGLGAGKVHLTERVSDAAAGADVLYTDVWVSMGREGESEKRMQALQGYQINQDTLRLAKPHALVMHCLPAYRGKEIEAGTFEAHAQTIFDEAENRLHVQKAILEWISG